MIRVLINIMGFIHVTLENENKEKSNLKIAMKIISSTLEGKRDG